MWYTKLWRARCTMSGGRERYKWSPSRYLSQPTYESSPCVKESGVNHKEINGLLDKFFWDSLKGLRSHRSLLSFLDCIYATDCAFIYPFAGFLSLPSHFHVSVSFSVLIDSSRALEEVLDWYQLFLWASSRADVCARSFPSADQETCRY